MKNVDDANKDKPFRSKVVFLGDFRQILFVVKKELNMMSPNHQQTFLSYENIANCSNFPRT